MRFAFSIGDYNGIFKWNFYGDATSHHDMSQFCEPVRSEEETIVQLTKNEGDLDNDEAEAEGGVFSQDQLLALADR